MTYGTLNDNDQTTLRNMYATNKWPFESLSTCPGYRIHLKYENM